MTGLQPRGFTWVIARQLAVSERIGGYGFQHRRVRREEEITWLRHAGVNAVLSLLEGNQNVAAYEAGGMRAFREPLLDLEPQTVTRVFRTMSRILALPKTTLLVHRDIIDEAVAGVLAGYLVHSRRVADPIVATALVQEILKRPLGPEARAIIPESAGA
ncbi:MAG: hypothetical protein A2Z12_02225 [Actinobacteria bacterium RBG_16_68_21]|nr:MAG: hypothetical protein A2Z12_02225 [Actinobacteria bacterium RBG_16_68_21]